MKKWQILLKNNSLKTTSLTKCMDKENNFSVIRMAFKRWLIKIPPFSALAAKVSAIGNDRKICSQSTSEETRHI